jgi:hypothetical protein
MANSHNPKETKMTSQQADTLRTVILNSKINGGNPKVYPQYLESDKRKQPRTLRLLVEAGYLSQTGDEFTVTHKIWNEITPESVDLIQIWNESRNNWNRKNFGFVRFSQLTNGQKRMVIENCDCYDWSILRAEPLRYQQEIQEGDQQGPITPKNQKELVEGLVALKEKCEKAFRERSRSYFESEVLISTQALQDHVKQTLEAEKFERLFKANLPWGLSALDIVSKDDGKEIVTSEEPDWVISGSGTSNLGADPEKWGENLTQRIANAKGTIERTKKRLAIMEQIERGITALGGWDVFKAQMREKMIEELKKEAKE